MDEPQNIDKSTLCTPEQTKRSQSNRGETLTLGKCVQFHWRQWGYKTFTFTVYPTAGESCIWK